MREILGTLTPEDSSP